MNLNFHALLFLNVYSNKRNPTKVLFNLIINWFNFANFHCFLRKNNRYCFRFFVRVRKLTWNFILFGLCFFFCSFLFSLILIFTILCIVEKKYCNQFYLPVNRIFSFLFNFVVCNFIYWNIIKYLSQCIFLLAIYVLLNLFLIYSHYY